MTTSLKKILQEVRLGHIVSWETLYTYTSEFIWELPIVTGKGPRLEDLCDLYIKPEIIKPMAIWFTVQPKNVRLGGEILDLKETEILESDQIKLPCLEIITFHKNKKGGDQNFHINATLAFEAATGPSGMREWNPIDTHITYDTYYKSGLITIFPKREPEIPKNTTTWVDRNDMHHFSSFCPVITGILSASVIEEVKMPEQELCHYCWQRYAAPTKL